MKNWIQMHYNDENKLSYDSLRQASLKAWNAVDEEQLKRLIDSMEDRCEAVIQANDMHINYWLDLIGGNQPRFWSLYVSR